MPAVDVIAEGVADAFAVRVAGRGLSLFAAALLASGVQAHSQHSHSLEADQHDERAAGAAARKQLLASLDQSLQRMGLDYIRYLLFGPVRSETPLEETASALATAVQQGKALC